MGSKKTCQGELDCGSRRRRRMVVKKERLKRRETSPRYVSSLRICDRVRKTKTAPETKKQLEGAQLVNPGAESKKESMGNRGPESQITSNVGGAHTGKEFQGGGTVEYGRSLWDQGGGKADFGECTTVGRIYGHRKKSSKASRLANPKGLLAAGIPMAWKMSINLSWVCNARDQR